MAWKVLWRERGHSTGYSSKGVASNSTAAILQNQEQNGGAGVWYCNTKATMPRSAMEE
jgi:hypothetical protein